MSIDVLDKLAALVQARARRIALALAAVRFGSCLRRGSSTSRPSTITSPGCWTNWLRHFSRSPIRPSRRRSARAARRLMDCSASRRHSISKRSSRSTTSCAAASTTSPRRTAQPPGEALPHPQSGPRPGDRPGLADLCHAARAGGAAAPGRVPRLCGARSANAAECHFSGWTSPGTGAAGERRQRRSGPDVEGLASQRAAARRPGRARCSRKTRTSRPKSASSWSGASSTCGLSSRPSFTISIRWRGPTAPSWSTRCPTIWSSMPTPVS